MIIAAIGDVHGKQHLMYQRARQWEYQHKKSIDLLLQVGDFETIATPDDWAGYFAPRRHHCISDFKDYAEGTCEAPIETLFVGGNHESWNHLEPFNNGGYVAPRIYYIGRANTVERNGVRIGGITGIFSPRHFRTARNGHPFKKSRAYFNAADLKKISSDSLDILLLHEWPRGLTQEGAIIKREGKIPERVTRGWGNPLFLELIKNLGPRYVFCGHVSSVYQEVELPTANGVTKVVCLKDIHAPQGSIYVFEYTPERSTQQQKQPLALSSS